MQEPWESTGQSRSESSLMYTYKKATWLTCARARITSRIDAGDYLKQSIGLLLQDCVCLGRAIKTSEPTIHFIAKSPTRLRHAKSHRRTPRSLITGRCWLERSVLGSLLVTRDSVPATRDYHMSAADHKEKARTYPATARRCTRLTPSTGKCCIQGGGLSQRNWALYQRHSRRCIGSDVSPQPGRGISEARKVSWRTSGDSHKLKFGQERGRREGLYDGPQIAVDKCQGTI